MGERDNATPNSLPKVQQSVAWLPSAFQLMLSRGCGLTDADRAIHEIRIVWSRLIRENFNP